RPHPDVDLRRRERRGVHRDEDIARARQAHAAGQGMSVDPAHDRLPELGHDDEQLDEDAPLPVLSVLRCAVLEAAQVRARGAAAIAIPTRMSTAPPSSSLHASTRVPSLLPSSSPTSDMATLITPIVAAASTIGMR